MRVCVAGLGVNGAAATRALAHAGADVVGVDPHAPPHTLGSSHGVTRIMRFAYYEHPRYVPLVRLAFEGWRALERTTGQSLFRRTGALSLGAEHGSVLRGVRASVQEHGLAHELLEPAEVARRFPGLRAAPGEVGLFEPDAGILSAEPCVAALLADATRAGADLRTGDGGVRAWSETADGVRVTLDRGVIEADALVLAIGPWLAGTDAGRMLGLVVERQPFFWYGMDPAGLPVTLRELPDGRIFYLAPGPGPRFKAALHHDGESCDPDSVGRVADAVDEARLRPLLCELVPAVARTAPLEGHVCLYTNAPDGHFIVDALPGTTRVLIVSACSGHGFKFAPAVGDAVAARLLGRPAATDLSAFGTGRLLGGARRNQASRLPT